MEPAVTKKPTKSAASKVPSDGEVAKMIAEEGAQMRYMAFKEAGYGATFMLRAPPELRVKLEESGFVKEFYRLFDMQKDHCGFRPREIDYLDARASKNLELHLHGIPIFEMTEAECLNSPHAAKNILIEFFNRRAHAFDMEVCVDWLKTLAKYFPNITLEIHNSIPNLFQVDLIRDILEDGLTLINPLPIMEAMLRAKDIGANIGQIADLARGRLKLNLVHPHLDDNGHLPAVMMNLPTEERFRAMTDGKLENAVFMVRDPYIAQMLQQIRAFSLQADEKGDSLVVITPSDIRRAFRAMLRAAKINVQVIGISEIEPTTEIKRVGMLHSVPPTPAQSTEPSVDSAETSVAESEPA
jgi:type III secretory pathway component EscV